MTKLALTILMFSMLGCSQTIETTAEIIEQTAEKPAVSLFAKQPTIRPNPQRRAPLVALVDVWATTSVNAELLISDGKNEWSIPGASEPRVDQTVIAHSMRPDRTHQVRVKLTEPETGVAEVSEPLEFVTPKLPKSFPPLEVVVAKSQEVEPGVLLFPVNLWRDDKSMMDFGYLIALNEQGEVIWYLNSGHRTADVRRLSNGHILFQHGNYRYAFEIDLLGNVVRQWHADRLTLPPHERSIPVDIDTMHHEIAEHPNGNFYTLSTDLKKWEKFPTSVRDPGAPWKPAYVVTDQLIEFEPATGNVVRRLELTDYLDKERFGYLSLGGFWKPKYNKRIKDYSRDWSHANALVLLPEEEAVIVSFRHHDCLIKIDLKTEKIVWILGTPDGWGKEWQKHFLKPVGRIFEWPYHQHGPQVTPDGNLRMYDNGNYRARPFEPQLPGSQNRSRVVEYEIDEEKMTVRQVWEYDGGQDGKFYCPFYCEADLLPQTGNYLITDGGHIELEDGTPYNEVPGKHQWARIFEIKGKTPHEKVFEVKFESPLRSRYGWSIYRSMKLKSLSDITVDFDRIPEPVDPAAGEFEERNSDTDNEESEEESTSSQSDDD